MNCLRLYWWPAEWRPDPRHSILPPSLWILLHTIPSGSIHSDPEPPSSSLFAWVPYLSSRGVGSHAWVFYSCSSSSSASLLQHHFALHFSYLMESKLKARPLLFILPALPSPWVYCRKSRSELLRDFTRMSSVFPPSRS